MEEIVQKSIFGVIAILASFLLASVVYFWGHWELIAKREGFVAPSVLAVLTAFMIYFGVQILLSVVLGSAGLQRSSSMVILTIMGLLVATPLLTWFSLRYQLWFQGTPISFLRILKEAALLWIMAFPLVLGVHNLMVVFLMVVLGKDYPFHQQDVVQSFQQIGGDPYLFWPFTLTVALVVPVAEEILFRGFLQGWLRRHFPDFWAIVIASLVFSSLHFSSLQGISNLAILPPLFILSLLLGFFYFRQRTLWAPIALHVLYNTLGICMIEL